MKLISCLSVVLLAGVPLSVMAEDVTTPTGGGSAAAVASDVAESDIVAEDNITNEEKMVSEPETVFLEENVGASPWYSGIELGGGVSATGGLDGFVGYMNKESSWWPMRSLGLRLNFASTKPIKSTIDSISNSLAGDTGFEIEDITIKDIEIDAKHIGVIVDFYPFGDTWFLGGWRLSGGYYKGDLNVTAGLTGGVGGLPDGNLYFSFGDTEYRYLGNTIRGTAAVDWDYSGPYLGTGIEFGLFAGLKIYLDAGVVFADSVPHIDADVPFTNLEQKIGDTWKTVENNPTLEAAVNAEKAKVLSDAQHELDKIDFYPMVKVGFMYRF